MWEERPALGFGVRGAESVSVGLGGKNGGGGGCRWMIGQERGIKGKEGKGREREGEDGTVHLLEDSVYGAGAAAAGHGDVEFVVVRCGGHDGGVWEVLSLVCEEDQEVDGKREIGGLKEREMWVHGCVTE